VGIPRSRPAQSDCLVVVLTVGKNRQLVQVFEMAEQGIHVDMKRL
jgi:hypothetical protein